MYSELWCYGNEQGPELAHLGDVRMALNHAIDHMLKDFDAGSYETEYFSIYKKGRTWELYESRETDCDFHCYLIQARCLIDALRIVMEYFGIDIHMNASSQSHPAKGKGGSTGEER